MALCDHRWPRPLVPQDAVADAKAAVAQYAGPQTTWEGPTSAPKPDAGKKIVFLSGDEQNDISHLYGVYIKEAGEKLGWKVTIIDGKGSPTSWLAGMNQAIALEAGRHRHVRRRRQPEGPDQGRRRPGHQVRRPARRRAIPARSPTSISSSTSRRIRARSARPRPPGRSPIPNGTARVVVLSHNEYAIAEVKSMATKTEIEKCAGLQGPGICQLAGLGSGPAPAAADHELGAALRPAASTPPRSATTTGTSPFPCSGAGGVDPDQVKLIAADGNRSAYDRIRKGGQYQMVTVSEPIELQAYQAIDELNRAFHGAAAERLRPAAVPGHQGQHPLRGRRPEHLHPQQRLQEALPGDLGRAQ